MVESGAQVQQWQVEANVARAALAQVQAAKDNDIQALKAAHQLKEQGLKRQLQDTQDLLHEVLPVHALRCCIQQYLSASEHPRAPPRGNSCA